MNDDWNEELEAHILDAMRLIADAPQQMHPWVIEQTHAAELDELRAELDDDAAVARWLTS